MSKTQQGKPGLHPKWLLYSIGILSSYGMPLITPIIPNISAEFSVPATSLGLLLMVFALPSVFITPLCGFFADLFPRRLIIIIATFFYTGGTILAGLSTSYEMLLACRFLQGVGSAPITLMLSTLVGDFFQAEERRYYMGRSFAVLCLGMIVFPLITGFLASTSWRLGFFVASLSVLPVYYCLWRTHMTPHVPGISMAGHMQQVLDVIKTRRALLIFLIVLCDNSVLVGIGNYLFPIFASQQFGANAATIGIVYSFSIFGTMAGSLVMPNLVQRFGVGSCLTVISLCCGISLIISPYLPVFFLLFIPMFLSSFNSGFTQPSMSTEAANLAPPDVRAAIISVNTTIFRLVQTIAPPFYGLLILTGGFKLAFMLGALSMIVLACAAFFGLRGKHT